MTTDDKASKSGRPSAFATVFSCGTPFPGLQAMCSAKMAFATAVAKQKHLVGETHPWQRSLLSPQLKFLRAEMSGKLAAGKSHSLRASPGHVLRWEGTCWPAWGGILQELKWPSWAAPGTGRTQLCVLQWPYCFRGGKFEMDKSF